MITVLFTCDRCRLTDKKVEVRFRRAEEDILPWVRHAVEMVSRCHSAVSPQCRAKTMTGLKIPQPKGEEGIGMEPPADQAANADEVKP